MSELTPVVRELYDATKRLEKATREIFKLATAKAEMERAYRQALAQEIVKLRADSTPATLIPDLARGNVSYFKFERDLAADTYKSAISSMEALKAAINALQSIAKYQSEV